MPTYEYACEKCQHEFEKFQPISDPALTICPKELCPKKQWGKGKVRKLISAGAGLLFKGTGFYITDYRSDKYKEAAKKDAGGASTAKPAADTGKAAASDSKPAPKTETKTEAKATKPKAKN